MGKIIMLIISLFMLFGIVLSADTQDQPIVLMQKNKSDALYGIVDNNIHNSGSPITHPTSKLLPKNKILPLEKDTDLNTPGSNSTLIHKKKLLIQSKNSNLTDLNKIHRLSKPSSKSKKSLSPACVATKVEKSKSKK
jgi:hypothetical protein